MMMLNLKIIFKTIFMKFIDFSLNDCGVMKMIADETELVSALNKKFEKF